MPKSKPTSRPRAGAGALSRAQSDNVFRAFLATLDRIEASGRSARVPPMPRPGHRPEGKR